MEDLDLKDMAEEITLVDLGAEAVVAAFLAEEEMAIKTDIMELAMVAMVIAGMVIVEELVVVVAPI
jgi:hypothetical protein